MPHWAEHAARAYLEGKGWRFVAANYRVRTGEIDLVMRDRGTVVFVEVRQRASARFGGAEASIDRRKIARVRRAARHFVATRLSGEDTALRIDAVLVRGPRGACTLRHVQGIG